jgi:hypothetical protein
MRSITEYIQTCILVIGGGGRKQGTSPVNARACAKEMIEDAAGQVNACTCAFHL